MKTCPYCGSDLEKTNNQYYYCDFCVMNISNDRVCENGDRLKVRVNDFVLEKNAYKTTPELMLLSSYELLYLLRYVRNERSNVYDNLSVINKASKETDQFLEIGKNVGDMYVEYTKRMFVLENIIRERFGYVPTKITDALLIKYLTSIEKDKNKPMIIRKSKQTNK